MDRSDEARRDVRRKDDLVRDNEREGDVLGLGGAPVPKEPGDPSAAYDEESVERRRERMRSDDRESGVSNPMPDTSDAPGSIDMGSGGEGTGLSGK
jgi:hypothetical protein